MGLGYQSLLRDLGQEVPVRVWTDSSAAIGICSRQGLGKLRHLDCHTLWVQQAARCKRIDLRKISGEVNPADIFTKHAISRDRMMKLVELFDCRFQGGRAASAPLVRQGLGTKTTMAEACAIKDMEDLEGDYFEGEQDPMMPHRRYDKKQLRTLYPPLEVPEDLEDEDPAENDLTFQKGMEIAKQIVDDADTHGRRRVVPS